MARTYIKKGGKQVYKKEDLEAALEAVKKNELSTKKAAKLFNIPRTTLRDHISGRRGKEGANGGRPTVLPAYEEQKLASCLGIMEKWGFGLSRTEVLTLVEQYCRLNNVKTPFKSGRPGPDWFILFKKRNKLSLKKPQAVEKARQKCNDPFIIYPYFELLENTINDLGLQDKPHLIYNLDETGFNMDPARHKSVGPTGQPSTRTTSGPGRENITVLLAASASGKLLPPHIIFQGKNMWDQWCAGDGDEYPGTTYSATTNGWVEGEVFRNYFKKNFVPHLPEERPILVIYDGHSTHMDPDIIQMAMAENITILKLPPHSTHLLQPLDLAVFKSLKSKWDELLISWQRRNSGKKLPKKTFSSLLGKTLKDLQPVVIENGFRKGGIFPFDSDVVPSSKFPPQALKRWLEFKNSNQQQQTCNLQLPNLERNEIEVPEMDELAPPFLESVVSPNIETEDRTIHASPPSISTSISDLFSNNHNSSFEELLLNMMQPALSSKEKKTKVGSGAEVLTSEEVYQRLSEKKLHAKSKKKPKAQKRLMYEESGTSATVPPKKKKKKKQIVSETSDESGSDAASLRSDSDWFEEEEEPSVEEAITAEGDFLVSKVFRKNGKSFSLYVAKVIEVVDGGYTVQYLKRQPKVMKFAYDDMNTYFLKRCDVFRRLSKPFFGSQGRGKGLITFTTDLSDCSNLLQ